MHKKIIIFEDVVRSRRLVVNQYSVFVDGLDVVVFRVGSEL